MMDRGHSETGSFNHEPDASCEKHMVSQLKVHVKGVTILSSLLLSIHIM